VIRAKGRRSHPRASYHQLGKLTGGSTKSLLRRSGLSAQVAPLFRRTRCARPQKPDYPPEGERQRRSGGLDLPPRELWVIDHLREGKPNKLIARQLDMQENTVRVHVRDILTTHGS
jgi:DNA-binding NarL/FixJ family response regulator